MKKQTPFEKACEAQRIDSTFLPNVTGLPEEIAKHLIATYKLIMICKWRNKNWVPDWDNYQKKWFPYFYLSNGGFALSDAHYGYWCTGTGGGSRLCLKSEADALWMGKNCLDLYKDLIK